MALALSALQNNNRQLNAQLAAEAGQTGNSKSEEHQRRAAVWDRNRQRVQGVAPGGAGLDVPDRVVHRIVDYVWIRSDIKLTLDRRGGERQATEGYVRPSAWIGKRIIGACIA